MVPKTQPLAWVVRAVSTQANSPRAQWRITSDGRIKNRESEAYINIIKEGTLRALTTASYFSCPILRVELPLVYVHAVTTR